MRLLTTTFFLISFQSFAQLTGTISGTATVCAGASGSYYITFDGLMGTPPYTFLYNINGGTTQSISTIAGNTVGFGPSLGTPGVFNYNLLSVQDATMAFQALSSTATLTVNALPAVSAGADQSICVGTAATVNGFGALTYTWANGVFDGVPFMPTTTLTYTVIGTSAEGCTNNDDMLITVNNLPPVNAGVDQEICIGNSVTLSGSGASTYSWDNGAFNGSPFFLLNTTTYTVTGVSASGCMNTDQVTVTVGSAPAFPFITIDSAYCDNGSIIMGQDATTANYSYTWNNGSTTSFITNLIAGPYVVDVYNNGCIEQFTIEVPLSSNPGSCAEITGSVYFDTDENCSINGADGPIANRLIVANPGNHLAVSDVNGNYSIQVPIGTYLVEEVINDPTYGNNCVLNYTVPILTVSDSIGGNNFLDTIMGDIDFQAYIFNTVVMPGFGFNVQVNYYNVNPVGSLMNMNAWFTIPPGVMMTGWSYPHTVSNDTVHFTLNTTQTFSSWVNFLAVGVTLGSPILFCTGIEVQIGEQIIANNTDCNVSIVVGSFDPNDKTMFLNGVQSDSTIYITDQSMEYFIRFQNTGTAPAQNIYILDTILETLDLNSFEFLTASHNCSVSILDGNVLKFNFPSIMLPDSTNNEPESHGFVRYRIRQSNQNILGTVINNTAYIYFDFNEAVITNTTYDIIVIDDLAIGELDIFNVKLYPNPTESILNIESESIINTISVFTSNGQLVKEFSPTSQKSTVDLSDLNQGVYLVELDSEKGRIVKRIIVE